MTETFQLSAEAAEAYESMFVPGFFAQWAPRLLDAAGVRAGHRLLDVACGTGIVARIAAPRVGPTGSVIGLDRNEAMLAVARQVRPDLDWRQGDATKLPFGAREFDVVVSQMALMFFPDPVAALREMGRVSRETVAVLVPGALANNPPYERFVDIVTRHAGADARNLVSSYFALGDLDRLAGLCTQAGLTVAAASRPVGESRFGSIEQFVAIEIDSTPLAERLDAATRESILAECRVAIEPWLTSDGLRFSFESNLVVAGVDSAGSRSTPG